MLYLLKGVDFHLFVVLDLSSTEGAGERCALVMLLPREQTLGTQEVGAGLQFHVFVVFLADLENVQLKLGRL